MYIEKDINIDNKSVYDKFANKNRFFSFTIINLLFIVL